MTNNCYTINRGMSLEAFPHEFLPGMDPIQHWVLVVMLTECKASSLVMIVVMIRLKRFYFKSIGSKSKTILWRSVPHVSIPRDNSWRTCLSAWREQHLNNMLAYQHHNYNYNLSSGIGCHWQESNKWNINSKFFQNCW